MAPSALLVADYIIACGQGTLTPLQIIKLAYISHGFTLALTDRPLFRDDVQAWKYGPVVPAIYDTLKNYGASPVPVLAYCDTGIAAPAMTERTKFFEKTLTKNERSILDRVVELYGKMSGIELMKLTHKDGSPWSKYYKKGKMDIVIPESKIKEHYKTLISDVSP